MHSMRSISKESNTRASEKEKEKKNKATQHEAAQFFNSVTWLFPLHMLLANWSCYVSYVCINLTGF